jgi:diketogulonate reductase-like aldo/keto reductase
VALRWVVQQRVAAVGVGFVVAEYDKEDLGIFDFQLTPQERTQLAAL